MGERAETHVGVDTCMAEGEMGYKVFVLYILSFWERSPGTEKNVSGIEMNLWQKSLMNCWMILTRICPM